jgi:DNA repair exonuclease SbcCD nuclease subunit
MWKPHEEVIAIFLADIHLSLKPPIWRSAEPDWLDAQRRILAEVRELQEKHKCPIYCAGDIFHRWNAPPELINFALEYLPDMNAIPGQHDLPLHNPFGEAIFWSPILPLSKEWEGDKLPGIHIAIIHKYVWIPRYSYPNAPKENRVQGKVFKNHKWLGYDIVIYGDNHKGFQTYLGTTTIFNCGGLVRRNSDEIDYKPQIGLLLSSGKIVPHYLDISKDKHLDINENTIEELDVKEFIQELERLEDTPFNFEDAVLQYLERKKPSPQVKDVLLIAMAKEAYL